MLPQPMIKTIELEFQTKGENDLLNITERIQEKVSECGASEGFALLFLLSTTASLAIMEWEEGLLSDFGTMMERIAPKKASYEHEKAWHDGNGHSHMRSTLLGASLTVPFKGKTLLLGQWQQLMLAEFDVRPRKRTLIMQIHGV